MKLSRYLETHRTSPAEFARRLGMPASTITRLLAGERSPGLALLQTIHVATRGSVTPNDFLPDDVVAQVPVAPAEVTA